MHDDRPRAQVDGRLRGAAQALDGSGDQTRWVTARQGACTATTGTPDASASRPTAATSWLTRSVHTISSTPSYPSSRASTNPARVDSG